MKYAAPAAIIAFIFCAIAGGCVRALHYDWGRPPEEGLVVADTPSPGATPLSKRTVPASNAALPFSVSSYIKGPNCKSLWNLSARNVADCLLVEASPTPQPSRFRTEWSGVVAGHVTRPDCTVTFYADQAPVDRRTPASLIRESNGQYGFTFDVPESLWRTQDQLVAECWTFPEFGNHRGVYQVNLPSYFNSPRFRNPEDPEFFDGVGRTIHFWISPGSTRFYGITELLGDDLRLTNALGLSSLEQLARESFNVNVNFHPLYDALRDPVLHIYKYNHNVFLTLRGDLQPYATVAAASNISIVVAPIQLLRAVPTPAPSPSPSPSPVPCVQKENFCSKIVVQLRGFTVTSFPPQDPNHFSQSLGEPAELNPDGSYVWYTSAAVPTSESVQITVQPYAPASATDVHHFLAAEAKVADPLIGTLINILHSLVGVAIVAVLLFYAGFWQHDDDGANNDRGLHERYCSVLVAAAFAGVVMDAGVWLGRCLFYLYLYLNKPHSAYHPLLGFVLDSLKWTYVVGILGAALCAWLVVHYLRRWKVMGTSRYFWSACAAIFSISFLGTLYSLYELFWHYLALYQANLNSSTWTVFSDAVLAVALFAILMISFQPHLTVQLLQMKNLAAQRWTFWLVVIFLALSAAIVLPSSAYFSADYAAPEFRIDVALTEAGPYISYLAVVIPILWFLFSSKRGAVRKTLEKRWHLALLFAVLAILTGYSYLGFPVTLLLTVAAVNYIALRPNADYKKITHILEHKLDREALLDEAEAIERRAAALQGKERAFQQFTSGALNREKYDATLKEYDTFIAENKPTVEAGDQSQATALAFGIGPKPDLLANAKLFAKIAAVPATLLTILSAQTIIATLPQWHLPFFIVFVQVVGSIIGYMGAGLGFGLAYPYLRGNIGTWKALSVILALSLVILPYEFMSGSRNEYLAQVLRWLVFFGTLGVTLDVWNAHALLSKRGRRPSFGDFFNVAGGVGNFAAIATVAATVATSLLTQESRELLDSAIHHAVPAQYALPAQEAPPPQ